MRDIKHHIQQVADRSKYWTKQGVWGDVRDAKTFTSMPRAYDYAEKHTFDLKSLWRIVEADSA